MPKSNKQWDEAGAAFFGLVFLAGMSHWIGYFILWLSEVYPAVVGLLVVALGVISWFWGSRDGNRAMNNATEKERRTVIESEKARKASVQRIEKAQDMENQAAAAMRRAVAQEAAATASMVRGDIDSIRDMQELTLEHKVDAALRVGIYPRERQDAYRLRREALVSARTSQWRTARRFGHELVPIVNRQGGICGDPLRDRGRKGCGCYLYCLPSTAVHLDHIRPRALGGSDREENMQALCSACNTSAGVNSAAE